jgi:hypothetical protein
MKRLLATLLVTGGLAVPVTTLDVKAGDAVEVTTRPEQTPSCNLGFFKNINGTYIGGWSVCYNVYHRVWVDCRGSNGSEWRYYASFFSSPGNSSRRYCPSTRPKAVRVGRQTSSGPVTFGFGVNLDESVLERFTPQTPSYCWTRRDYGSIPNKFRGGCDGGTGSFQVEGVCYYFDNGPYTIRSTTWHTTPWAFGWVSCPSDRPFLYTVRLDFVYP